MSVRNPTTSVSQTQCWSQVGAQLPSGRSRHPGSTVPINVVRIIPQLTPPSGSATSIQRLSLQVHGAQPNGSSHQYLNASSIGPQYSSEAGVVLRCGQPDDHQGSRATTGVWITAQGVRHRVFIATDGAIQSSRSTWNVGMTGDFRGIPEAWSSPIADAEVASGERGYRG